MIPMMALAKTDRQTDRKHREKRMRCHPSVTRSPFAHAHGVGSSTCVGAWYFLSSHACSQELSPFGSLCGSLSEREAPLWAFLRISYTPRSTVC